MALGEGERIICGTFAKKGWPLLPYSLMTRILAEEVRDLDSNATSESGKVNLN